MSTNMFALLDMVVLGYGLYVIYGYYLMKTKGEVKASIMLGSDVSMKKCKDKAGFLVYMQPKLLIFGIAAVVTGGLGLYNDFIGSLSYIYIVITAIFVVILIWFAVMCKKSVKLFW